MDLRIIEKPESIGWDEIHACLWEANDVNRAKGIHFKSVGLTGEGLQQTISRDAVKWTMFVAMDGDRLVGCAGVSILQKSAWYAQGKIGYLLLTGVVPAYKGNHLNTRLVQAREEWLLRNGVEKVCYCTAVNNTLKIKADMSHGYKLVDFFAPVHSTHYCVFLCKWLGKSPSSDGYVLFRFMYKKFKVMLRYKVGGKKRFGI